jgi:hypothetical protein
VTRPRARDQLVGLSCDFVRIAVILAAQATGELAPATGYRRHLPRGSSAPKWYALLLDGGAAPIVVAGAGGSSATTHCGSRHGGQGSPRGGGEPLDLDPDSMHLLTLIGTRERRHVAALHETTGWTISRTLVAVGWLEICDGIDRSILGRVSLRRPNAT